MKKLPVGEPSFYKIISGDQLYVDKTEFYHKLLHSGGGYYFLSRPRRFGKSLLISTFKSLFEGKKELFEGLWIYDKHDFEPHPVVLISFTGFDFHRQPLEIGLMGHLDEIATSQNLSLSQSTSKGKFKELIQKLGKNRKVVVLVDEYDKPIIDFFNDIPHAVENRETLRNFFGILKDHDIVPLLHFVFITGVSKFSKVSLFSEMNHLVDLTIRPDYAGMLGITQAELEHYFADRLDMLQQKLGLTQEALLDKIKQHYNGFSWDGKTLVYNPFSLLNFFSSETFGSFWFASGTASFLIKAFQARREPVEVLEEYPVNEGFFDKYDIENIDLYSLMWQTGYLSIREVEERPQSNWYILGFPNNEVRNAFNQQLLEAHSYREPSTMQRLLYQAEKALLTGQPEAFVKELKAIFADLAYEMLPKDRGDDAKLNTQWEGYFQVITLLIVKVLGINVRAEYSVATGRLDAVFETPEYVYLVEFKLGGSAGAAMQQIKDKDYPAAFLAKQKPVFLLALSFNKDSRNVQEFLVEKLAEA
jgi:hypothetical protein